MASVRRRPHKGSDRVTWAVLFKLGDKQTSVPWQTELEAKEFCALVNTVGGRRAMEIEGIPLPKSATPQPRTFTVEQWLTHHIENLTGVEQGTIDKYRAYVRNDIGPTLGAIPLDKLAEEDIAAWVKHMETTPSAKTGRPLSHKSIKNVHGFLSGALAAAVPRHIPANPAAGRRLPKGTGDDTEATDRMLSRDEFDRLLAATTDYWKPLIEFLVASGCRWGEAVALRPGDVDRAAGTVRIRRATKYSSAGYEIGATKTKRSNRSIDVDTAVLDKLDYSHEFLFVNRAGGPVRYAGFKRRVWDPAVRRAKLDPPPSPHALRHTCASWMLMAGVPMLVVSRHMGHESALMTADVYGGLDRTATKAAAAVMGELLARPPQKAIEAGTDQRSLQP